MSLRKRLGAFGARRLARNLPDMPAEDIDAVAGKGRTFAGRFPALVGNAGPLESAAEALWDEGRYAEAVSYSPFRRPQRRSGDDTKQS